MVKVFNPMYAETKALSPFKTGVVKAEWLKPTSKQKALLETQKKSRALCAKDGKTYRKHLKVKVLEKDLLEQQDGNSRLRNTLRRTHQKVMERTEELNALAAECKSCKQHCEILKKANEDLTDRYWMQRRVTEGLQTRLSSSPPQPFDLAEQKILEFDKENTWLCTENEQFKEVSAKQKHEIDTLRAWIENDKVEIENLEEVIDGLPSAQKTPSGDQTEALSQELMVLREENSRLGERLELARNATQDVLYEALVAQEQLATIHARDREVRLALMHRYPAEN